MSSDAQAPSDGAIYETTGPSIGRRRFIQGAGAAGALAVAGSNSRISPMGNAAAVVPLAPVGIAAGGAALGYLVNEGVDYLIGDSRDYSGYTGANALHSQIVEGMASLAETNEITRTTLSNNIEHSDNITLPKGKAAAVEAMNDGLGQSKATEAMQEAINGAFSVMQKNLLKHWNAQVSQVLHMWNQVGNHDNLTTDTVFVVNNDTVGTDALHAPVKGHETATLLDGTEHTVHAFVGENTGNSEMKYLHPLLTSTGWRYIPSALPIDASQVDRVAPMQPAKFSDLWQSLLDAKDRVNGNLSTFIADIYSEYEPGEIPLEDVVDPFTAYTEMNQAYEDGGYYGYAGASAATLGIPTAADASTVLEVETDDGPVEVTADLYTSHVPTDADGNEVGFQTGQRYTPANWSEPLFIAFETAAGENGETTQDFTQLEDPFEIIEAYDSSGSEIDSFSMESKNLQTANVENLQKELEQLRNLQLEMQEEAQAQGGGSGGSGGVDLANEIWGIPVIGWAIGGIAGIAALLQGMNQ